MKGTYKIDLFNVRKEEMKEVNGTRILFLYFFQDEIQITKHILFYHNTKHLLSRFVHKPNDSY